MSNVPKLKKKAAEFEQKKQFDKALALYIQILEESASPDDVDVGLYNRVGDLLLRQGSVGDAVTYYEKAVDLYAEGGFYDTAIALCNKILRQSPGRSSIYYKLGKISAKKGFKSDAKQNFLEYADRMQKAGEIDEAFRALKEFADLCPDQEDVRLMLAEQLAKKGRRGEALEQLQALYDRFEAEGRGSEARATVDRMKAIDPDIDVGVSEGPKRAADKRGDLVFLDVTWDETPRGTPASSPVMPPRGTPSSIPAPPPPRPTVPTSQRPTVPVRPPVLPPEDEPLVPHREPMGAAPIDMSASMLDLEPTGFPGASTGRARDEGFDVPDDAGGGTIAGLESTLLDDLEPAVDAGSALLGLEPPLSGAEFATLPLETPTGVPAVRQSAHDLALPGELPMLDVSGEDGDDEATGGDLQLIMPGDDEIEFDSAPPTMLGDLEPPIARRTGAAPVVPRMLDLEVEHSNLGELVDDEAGFDGDVELPMLSMGDDEADELSPLDAVEPASLDFMADVAPRGSAVLPTAGDLAAAMPDERRAEPAMALPDDAGIAPATIDAMAEVVETTGEAAPAPSLLEFTPSTNDALDAALGSALDEGPGAMPFAEEGAPPRRGSTSILAQSVDGLRLRAAAEPDNWAVRRQYAEALFEDGDRDAGLQELELVMIGYERADDLESARGVAEEIIRLNPASVRHHQKCVEYAFRRNDRPRLVDAYLHLADALFRSGQPDKSRAVYQRVLELAPDDVRVHAALASFADVAPAPAPRASGGAPSRPTTTGVGRRYTVEQSAVDLPPVAPAAERPDDEFVNLGDWLRDGEAPKSTRMVVGEEAPSGDEQADFNEMLRKFKQGVAENVEEEDHESHYDLGVAFKEMGLVDEAIAEFQKALRGAARRVRTYEALGQCFIEKSQFPIAATILQRALAEGHSDDQLVGVLYLLGYAMEALQRWTDAIGYYERVFAVDIQFRDVGDRLNALAQRVTK